MINFTNCNINKYKYYGGTNGNKICIIYNNEDYMLKLPYLKKEKTSYSNSCISEYISCQIIKTLELNVQETILGTFKDKIGVACKDFTGNGYVLKQFAELKNSQIETSENGYGTELNEVIETIDNQTVFDQKELKNFFWDMFIVDALLGNFDRHNGNWGFLVNAELKDIKIAPIFDCGSCLYPQPNDEMLKSILNDEKEMNSRVFVFPTSVLKENNKKINYFDYISSLQNDECNQALKRIFPRINLKKINTIITETPFISDIRKQFYQEIIKLRYEKILKYSYDKLIES